jgi:hypothetical protein
MVNTPKAHLDYLVQHANDPKVRKDFKKKYGYLPGGD